ncbi:MAG: thioredoxin-dependent thiol peroxidase [Acidimicrobiia bacterium]|nr:thioredoxin-dependent thiol peroxidase [bacterium]MDE0674686.1 thioredoxin-dependent thiol peroxidase [bacterium]MXX01670.1 thioredoxin-dependent thiol peroxidase [Acidimicrobiia bacterium]MYA39693.1 thioredoxin-dependent thiol peroxidase [Acidimicrobiia bacterium]MYH06856.1 thioredoxin-dependent thiol peroxidase [Acidimicrobiia bacterium]
MNAPDYTLLDQDRNPVSLSDFSGQRVVVFFYPKAMTPGCTAEACDFRDSYEEFLAAGMAVVGLSPDPPEALAEFREKEGLPFPLLSDADHKMAEAFGAWGVKKLYGRETVGLIRSTFVLGSDGELEREYRNVRATGHVARLKRDLLGA